MKDSIITVKGKLFKTVPFEFQMDYSEPTDWTEACALLGEKKAFQTFLNKFKPDQMDKKRNAYIKEREDAALKDPDKKAQLEAILGI
jgi:hypothetical protein